jgi:hypothetical protein
LQENALIPTTAEEVAMHVAMVTVVAMVIVMVMVDEYDDDW